MAEPTERLYFRDPLLFGFDATVLERARFGEAPSVILDKSAFYPESGGQLADHGRLGDAAVIDVQLDDEGRVHHLIDGALPEVGASVHGTIDAHRRRVHMALHTGQHMLSRALLEEAGGDTVSSRLGETSCTIDLDIEKADEAAIARAEAVVNAIIDEDREVRALFPTPEELAAFNLRRPPKVSEGIRVIEVEGYDVTPCGGTHCTRTSQIGLLRVTGLERHKKKVRVSFSAGPRARGELFAQSDILKRLADTFTCGFAEVEAGMQKLRRENKELKDRLGSLRTRLADAVALELQPSVTTSEPFIHVFDDAEADFVRRVAQALLGPGKVVLLAGRGADDLNLVAGRGEGADFECGAFVKAVCQAAGGRGGGKPDFAQGKLPKDADFEALARAALSS